MFNLLLVLFALLITSYGQTPTSYPTEEPCECLTYTYESYSNSSDVKPDGSGCVWCDLSIDCDRTTGECTCPTKSYCDAWDGVVGGIAAAGGIFAACLCCCICIIVIGSLGLIGGVVACIFCIVQSSQPKKNNNNQTQMATQQPTAQAQPVQGQPVVMTTQQGQTQPVQYVDQNGNPIQVIQQPQPVQYVDQNGNPIQAPPQGQPQAVQYTQPPPQ